LRCDPFLFVLVEIIHMPTMLIKIKLSQQTNQNKTINQLKT
jgi:hypothetical protein